MRARRAASTRVNPVRHLACKNHALGSVSKLDYLKTARVEVLCKSTVTKVKELNLSINRIGLDGAKAIAALCALPPLSPLDKLLLLVAAAVIVVEATRRIVVAAHSLLQPKGKPFHF